MTFTEFLKVQREDGFVRRLAGRPGFEKIPALFFEPLCVKARRYMTVGGMPEAVDA